MRIVLRWTLSKTKISYQTQYLKNKNMSKLSPANIQLIKQIKICLQSSEIKLGDLLLLIFIWHPLKTQLCNFIWQNVSLEHLNYFKYLKYLDITPGNRTSKMFKFQVSQIQICLQWIFVLTLVGLKMT